MCSCMVCVWKREREPGGRGQEQGVRCVMVFHYPGIEIKATATTMPVTDVLISLSVIQKPWFYDTREVWVGFPKQVCTFTARAGFASNQSYSHTSYMALKYKHFHHILQLTCFNFRLYGYQCIVFPAARTWLMNVWITLIYDPCHKYPCQLSLTHFPVVQSSSLYLKINTNAWGD